ncbi:MAG: DUF3280 domain-containing protein [Beijerinckiaceae bacterium]|nr:DUF3280 domain-containing protein [Beijerinckiaceae bacterium]MCI0735427.1 DUF3280 domain-containing protein [Beijerinckiaceae bacterium]
MKKKMKAASRFMGSRFLLALSRVPSHLIVLAAVAIPALTAGPAYAKDDAIALAIVDFSYNDTSGEPADQRAIHRTRLVAFMQSIIDDLTRGGKYRLVSLACGPDPCSITQTPSAQIIDKASKAGARLLLFGGIHKMSTLIQWAKVQAVDLKTEKLVFDRLFTFRGDTDEAWRRAEAFVVEQMAALDFAK